jgi:hypothetical protein
MELQYEKAPVANRRLLSFLGSPNFLIFRRSRREYFLSFNKYYLNYLLISENNFK